MDTWRKVWRNGFAPALSINGLRALRRALASNDSRLAQGATTFPPPLASARDWPVEAACALGFCAWQGEQLETVGEVGEFFSRCCFEADQRIGKPAASRWFLKWFDDTPREEMRRELLTEVNRAIHERYSPMAPAKPQQRDLYESIPQVA